jgi:restriction endonuclease S subunit
MARSTASWREVGFNEAFQRLKLKAFEIPTKDYQVAGTYPIIDQGDGAVAGYIDREDPISDVPFIVFGDHTTIVKYVDQPCFIGSQGVVPLKARECYDPYFLYLMLGRTRIPALGYSRHFRELENKTFPLPTLAEQRKIAEILRTWDEAIETAEAELKAKQERKRGLVGKLVGACGELASHARSLWPLVALSNFSKSKSGDSTLIKGKLFKEPGLGLFPAYSATGQDVWRDTYAHDMTAIVVSAVGARCGRTFIACGKWSAIANTQVILPDLAKVEPYYLNLFLNDEKFWVRGGSAQPFVVPSKTLKKKIPLPPLAEQQKIVNILQDADADIELINERINALRTQKRGLMQKLLTGEVRVAA